VELPPGEWFRPRDVAALLGVTLGAIAKRLRSLGLTATATGAGRARRYPRATVEALLAGSREGMSPATVNHYIVALRGLAAGWCVVGA
jgi:hypothetical protein